MYVGFILTFSLHFEAYFVCSYEVVLLAKQCAFSSAEREKKKKVDCLIFWGALSLFLW